MLSLAIMGNRNTSFGHRIWLSCKPTPVREIVRRMGVRSGVHSWIFEEGLTVNGGTLANASWDAIREALA